MNIYSITIEVKENSEKGYFQNHAIVANNAVAAIDLLLANYNSAAVDISELEKLEDTTDEFSTNEIIESSGRSYFMLE